MRRWFGRALLFALVAFVGLGPAGAADEKPKYTIVEVMREAHRSGLVAKVVQGRADRAEKERLVALYEALSLNKPPRGDDADWQRRTGEILAAAKACLKDEKDAGPRLAKLVNCAGCHAAAKRK